MLVVRWVPVVCYQPQHGPGVREDEELVCYSSLALCAQLGEPKSWKPLVIFSGSGRECSVVLKRYFILKW